MRINKATRQWRQKILILLGSYLLTIMPLVKADIAVIVNPTNSGASVTRSDIQEIFLGLQTKLSNGNSVVPIDQSSEQPIRQSFYELVAGKSPVQMKSYWSRLIFTGKGSPPQALSNGSAVKQKVASDKNAIGYVDAASAKGDTSVSTVFVIPTQ